MTEVKDIQDPYTNTNISTSTYIVSLTRICQAVQLNLQVISAHTAVKIKIHVQYCILRNRHRFKWPQTWRQQFAPLKTTGTLNRNKCSTCLHIPNVQFLLPLFSLALKPLTALTLQLLTLLHLDPCTSHRSSYYIIQKHLFHSTQPYNIPSRS